MKTDYFKKKIIQSKAVPPHICGWEQTHKGWILEPQEQCLI